VKISIPCRRNTDIQLKSFVIYLVMGTHLKKKKTSVKIQVRLHSIEKSAFRNICSHITRMNRAAKGKYLKTSCM